jgi:aspartyl-tRNA(Asn)/glutamyl-tRNA(Gln) amidotransferase subunit A
MVKPNALEELSLKEASDLIATGEVSSSDLVEATLRRIDALDSALTSYIHVAPDRVRAAGKAADAAIAAGYRLGPLHGIPIAVKDIVAVRGEPMTCGSKVLARNVAEEDATVTAHLRTAGAIFVGRLNMHEFAYGVTTENPHYGTAHNPWNLDHSAGGSSGGSGVSVAARLCYGALGTDTGCSVRLPASYNGIVGIRPSIGRVSNSGVGTLAWTLDTVGPMTRTVEDCALMLKVMAGHDLRDGQTALVPVPDYLEQMKRGLDGVRLALIEDYSLTGLHPDVARAMEQALADLEKAGATIIELPIPELEPAISALLTVDIAEPSAYHAEWLRSRGASYGADVRGLLQLGELYLASHYIQAQRYRTVISEHFANVLARADVIITPTVPFTVPKIGQSEVEMPTGDTVDIITAVMKYNALPPLAGLPAMSVPCGFSKNGLPIGMQIVGRGFGEGAVFNVGHAYQQMTSWHRRAPSLAAAA